MIPEFGQAPLCLELDLDSYEGSWTHVAAFRGRSGWLTAARATIQSEHDLTRTVLLAACDDYENPIPAWRAAHLVTCDWSNLEECRELPPDLLDDLLCEEEGAFFARWQRETNGELVTLHERAQHDLAVLDACTAAIQRQVDHEIAELQRRRRHPDATPDARSTLAHLIAQIESDGDAAVSKALSRRGALRREINAAEEALWERADVLVEVEPIWCVHWQATALRRRARPPARRGGWQEAKGADLTPAELANGRLLRATRAARLAVREAANEARAPLQPVVPRGVNDPVVMLRQARQELGQAEERVRNDVREGKTAGAATREAPVQQGARVANLRRGPAMLAGERQPQRRSETSMSAGSGAGTLAQPLLPPATPSSRPLPAGAAYALTQYRRDRERAARVDAEAVAELANHREGTQAHTQRVVGIARRRARIAKLDARIADLERRMGDSAKA